MPEFIAFLILSFLGFIAGGVIGEFTSAHAWFPAAWHGLIVAWGGCVCCLHDWD